MTNHSNVQVGEVVESYRDKTGRLWKTEVDDVGFFVVIKLRDDIEKAKEINRGIRKGSLRSFSIGGQALEKVKKNHQELGDYNEISKLELHEVTICEKGINPEARFDILKQEKNTKQEVKNMSKIEKALEEVDALMAEVNTLRKEEDDKEMMDMEKPKEMEKGNYEKLMEKEEEDEKMMGDGEKMMDDEERKAVLNTLDAGGIEIGEHADRIVIDNGNPKASDLPVVKAFDNSELETLDLSVANIEKAYEAFRQEQLEKLAYDNLQKSFEARFNREVSAKESILAKSQYDAQSEIASLKDEFTALRKSLTAEKETILKAQEEATVELPSMDELAEMDWSDIHKMVGGFN